MPFKLPILTPIYTYYIIRHQSALGQFQALPQTPALTAYLQQTKALSHAHTNAWDIPSLLIKPMQRITKYALLFGAIYNETPETHGDKANLLEAKERAAELAAAVNEGARRWAVVKGVLGQGKANSAVNGAPPVASSTVPKGGPPKLGRMRSIRTKLRAGTSDGAELDRGKEDLEVWERRIKECEMVVKELAKREWLRSYVSVHSQLTDYSDHQRPLSGTKS